MIRPILAAALAATLAGAVALPAAAVAQAYRDSAPGYYDPPQAGDYGRDSVDRDDENSDNGYNGGDDRYGHGDDRWRGDTGQGYGGQGYGDRFTGRVGAAWRDDDGRRCQWREVARRDEDGYDAYKWVTVCR